MARNFGAFRDWDRPDPLEDNFRMADSKQIAYIDDMRQKLGKTDSCQPWLLSYREATALIHDLHLEWLREQGD